jgi:hypothetical protein
MSYAIDFHTFLRVMGIPEDQAGEKPIPDQFITRQERSNRITDGDERSQDGPLEELIRHVAEIPFFLRHAINDISRLPSTSLRTVFWIGGIKAFLHRYLENALFVAVDRHKKLPVDSRSRPEWNQSFYVVLKRDGSYLVGPCGIEDGTLVMHPSPECSSLRQEFRNHHDAEVEGQACTLVRKL